MACHHIGLKGVAKANGTDDTVKEYCRLRHAGLLQLLVCTVEHDISDAEAKDFVGLLEEVLSNGMIFIEVFAHSDELGTLTGKYVSFHIGN